MIKAIKELLNGKRFCDLRRCAIETNPWFTSEFIDIAVLAIEREFLDEAKLAEFCSVNQIYRASKNKTLGVVCAGNIPLVGFGDMFYGLLLGWNVVLKPSSKDPLMRIFEELPQVTIVDDISKFGSVDAIALMGSDSTCRIIDDKFPDTPMLLRGSMHSIAVIDQLTTVDELKKLFSDIFLYCGRGCRNVTHLYVESGVELSDITAALNEAKDESSWDFPQCWYDCVRYERAMMAMKGREFTDGKFYLLAEGVSTSIGTIGYEFFSEENNTIDFTKVQYIAQRGNFGEGQYPTLFQFANKESVVEFLNSQLF